MTPKLSSAIFIAILISLMINLFLVFDGCVSREQLAVERLGYAVVLKDIKAKETAIEDRIAKLNDLIAELNNCPGLTNTKPSRGYLSDLEQLTTMVTKGTLTPKEFEEQKKRLLASSYPVPTQAPVIDTAPTALSMTDLDKQLRLLAELYQNSTINSLERDDKKRQLLAKPIVLIDMKADLEMVSALFQQSMINNIERDELKRKLLQMEPVGK